MQEWQKAIDDYARVITDSTTDDVLLSNQALALAESLLSNGAHVLVPTSEREGTLTERRLAATGISNPWVKLAAAHQIRGDQEAIDRLVDRRPNLAGPIGDLFTQGKDEQKDWRRAISLYSKGITAEMTDVVLLSKRARAMRRSRIGMPRRPTGRGPRPRIRMGQNCSPTSHDAWRKAA